jgi:hypothetical protein
MTVTTTYGLGAPTAYFFSDGVFGSLLPSLQLTSLANGNVAWTSDLPGTATSGVGIATAGTLSSAGSNTAIGLGSQIDQLKNGDLVVVGNSGGDTHWQLFTTTGGTTTMSGELGGSASSNADVAALRNGGFVIADQLHFSGLDNDIRLESLDATGAISNDIDIDASTADDENPSVAVTSDGSVAVAWDRVVGATSSAYFAVYNSDLSVRVAPHMFDNAGSENDSLTAVSLTKGGFAVAYVDNGWDIPSPADITVETYKANGSLMKTVDVTAGSPAGADSAPSMALLANGLLAVTWTHDNGAGAGDDVYLQLIDQKSGHLLLASPELIAGTADNERASSVASLGTGDVLVSYFDDTSGEKGKIVPLLPTFEGGDTKDLIRGSGAFDVINGNGGSDVLKGDVGDDSISGGDGRDVINGGAGSDQLTGGLGHDSFQFSAISDIDDGDVIYDLQKNDHINLAKIDADINVAGDQAFTIVSAFTHHAGQMTIDFNQTAAGYTMVLMDVDGDGAADGFIAIAGDHSTFTNFAL